MDSASRVCKATVGTLRIIRPVTAGWIRRPESVKRQRGVTTLDAKYPQDGVIYPMPVADRWDRSRPAPPVASPLGCEPNCDAGTVKFADRRKGRGDKRLHRPDTPFAWGGVRSSPTAASRRPDSARAMPLAYGTRDALIPSDPVIRLGPDVGYEQEARNPPFRYSDPRTRRDLS